MVKSSTSLKNGGASRAPHEPLNTSPNYHDFIKFHTKSKLAIFLLAAPLYAQNCSLREIEKRLKIPKSTIKEVLKKYNFELKMVIPSLEKCRITRPSSTIPFGYSWKENFLQRDEKEFFLVQEILKLHQSKKSFRTIAAIMNAKGLRTRKKCLWHHESVKMIFNRSKKMKV